MDSYIASRLNFRVTIIERFDSDNVLDEYFDLEADIFDEHPKNKFSENQLLDIRRYILDHR